MNSDKVKLITGLVFILWPIFRAVGLSFGIDLPDIGPDGELIGHFSTLAGAKLLADAPPPAKKA